jgi:transposase InsO family protein
VLLPCIIQWIRHVKVDEECVIPARSEFVVKGLLPEKYTGDVMISSIKDVNESGGLVIARTVVEGNKRQCCVRVMNLLDEPRVLRKGNLLAGAEQVEEMHGYEQKLTSGGALPSHLQQVFDAVKNEACLTASEEKEFKQFLMQHKTVFAADDADLGRTSVVQHDIDTGNTHPIRQPHRRLPMAQQEVCDKEIQSMLDKGVIERGQSPWASPVVLVKKKDGSVRFCVDYRKLNAATTFDAYPLPRIDETLESLGGAKWFTTLDLLSGYWQVGLTPEAKLKSAFCVRSGLYLWNVMPFGLCNAPGTFERLMEEVLQGLQWASCLVYLDDVVIFGKDKQQLLQRMHLVFERLQRAGLKVKPKKCKFFQKETEYLGHVICGDGVKVSPEKVAAMKDWPVPKCVSELRSFLGTASYYRRFVLNFAQIAAPLHDLTKQNAKFVWSEACQAAFEQLKRVLCEAPVLAFPVKDAMFVLDTDASDRGIGGVLSQLIPVEVNQAGGTKYEERVLAYASRTLDVHERRYCTTRKELLAVVWFMRYFRPYLYGREFIVRSDHSSLQWLCSFWEPEGQIARWLQVIGEYNFKVEHREGKKHGNADGLSRQGSCKQCGKCEETVGSGEAFVQCPERLTTVTRRMVTQVRLLTLSPEWTPNQLSAWQQLDPDMLPVWQALKEGREPSAEEVSEWSAVSKRLMWEWKRLKLVDDVMYREWYDSRGRLEKDLLVVPRRIRSKVMEAAHDGEVAGHYGERPTGVKVREHFYWPGMQSDIRRYCSSCDVCQQSRAPPKRPHHPLQQDQVGEPMQRVTVDILQIDKRARSGAKYILVAVDKLTKWAEAFAMQDETAETICDVLAKEVVCRMGFPAQIHSDQGRQFESEVFQQLCEMFEIRKTRTTTMHPQSNGQTERMNRTLLGLLKKMARDDPLDWDNKLPFVMMAYRSTPHSTTDETPNKLMLGREVTTPLTLLAPPPPDAKRRKAWIESLHENFAESHALVRDHVNKAQRTQKRCHDSRAKLYNFQEGDAVWLIARQSRKGVPYKIDACRWEGPYDIKEKKSDAVFVIVSRQTKRSFVVSADKLKPCIERQVESEDESCTESEGVSEDVNDGASDAHESVEEAQASASEYEDAVVSGGEEGQQAEEYQDEAVRTTTRPHRNRRQPDWYGDWYGNRANRCSH